LFASTSNRARAAIFLALPFAILLAGCAVPLAPGYQVEKESLTVRFLGETPPHLAIRADYQLKNVGTTPLGFVEVTVPAEKTFGRSNLRILVANREITAQSEQDSDSESASSESASAESIWRIPLAPALRKKQKINVSLEYDLAATAPTDSRIFAAENMFYLNDSGWFPEFQEPKALFAEDITRPNPTDLTVIAPANFLVTASGQPHGEKKTSAATERHFRITTGDFDPYVLAGAYQQQQITANGSNIAIWTFQPVPVAQAQQTAAQIAAAANFYSQNFGPLPKSVSAIFDVETSNEAAARNTNEPANENWIIPGVVYDWKVESGKSFSAAFGNALSEAFGPIYLAHTWFAHVILPRPEAWTLAQNFDVYASVISSAGKTPAQNADVSSILSDYDEQREKAIEKPIASLMPNAPEDQLELGGDKMQLFFFALQDRCGRENVIHAMHHMVYALRGQQYGYSDFRAALEQECHQDLAGFFRTWLTQPGIPPDFRARYQPGATKP
jgi:hypothetical protein